MSETKDIDAINGSYKIRTDFDTNQNETVKKKFFFLIIFGQ